MIALTHKPTNLQIAWIGRIAQPKNQHRTGLYRKVSRAITQGVFVDVDSGEVRVDGAELTTLTNLEYRLLLMLHERTNKICSKEQIIQAVWGDEYIVTVDDGRIEKLVSRLRSKLERNPSEPRYLTTIRGRGYKLVGA